MPEPSQLSWKRDVFGNHVATARFSDRASELRFESTIRLDHAPAGFPEADIENFARTYPFAYGAGRKIAKKIAKNKRCYANTLRPRSRMLLKVMKGGLRGSLPPGSS